MPNSRPRFTEFVHRQRRGAELTLLILSLAIGIGAYAAVGVGKNGAVPVDLVGYGTWLVVVIIGAHIAVRILAPYADPTVLPIISALNGLGLALIERIHLSQARAPMARTQLMWMTIGIIVFVAILAALRDHRRLQAYTYTSGFAAVCLLLMPLIPGLGTKVNGAQIWIHVGSFSFQPGEVAKVLLIITFSGYLVVHRDALALAGRRFLIIDLPRGRDLGPIFVMWVIAMMILLLQNDLGFPFVLFGLMIVMLYIATERPGWVVVGGLLAVVGGIFAYFAFSHVKVRFEIWNDPFHYAGSIGYQIVQGYYGMAWGGLTGRGLGLGQPQITPFSYSDFISATVGEELGLTGLLAVLLMYVLLIERCLRTALIARDNFGKLLATGLATVFVLQVFAVVGGVVGLIPLTGLTTPFLSYGGSSLVSNWAVAALLLRMSDHARRPLPEWDDDDMQMTQVVPLR